jgi:hypothetical protein
MPAGANTASVMYLEKTNEVMMVGNDWEAQSHIAQERVPFGFTTPVLVMS